jgi:DNA topoisomerase-3
VIKALPESVGRPDMTAVWEQSLEQIYQKSQSYNQFMGSVEVHLNRLLQDTQTASFQGLAGKGKASFKRFKKGKRSASKGKSSAKSPRAKSKA